MRTSAAAPAIPLILLLLSCGPNDEMITDRVNYELANQSIEWAEFSVAERHVTLRGMAPSEEARASLAPIVSQVLGVKGVTDETVVDTAVVRRAQQADECSAGFERVLGAGRVEFQGARIQRASNRILDELATVLAGCPDAQVEIGAYTDSQGADEANLRVSQQRADAVRTYLAGKGLSADRLTATGFGEANPIADNATAAGRTANRRIELTVVTP